MLCVVVIAATVWLRQPTANGSILFIDEAAYYALGARLALPGAHLYSHTTDQKPPLGPVTYRIAALLGPESPIAAVHAATTICVAVTALLLVVGSTALLGAPWAGFIAGLLYALCSSSVQEGQAPWFAFSSLEHFQAPWLLAFVLLFSLSLMERSLGLAATAGVLLGVAGLYKQNAPVLLAPASAVALIAAWRGRLRVPQAVALTACAAAGATAVTLTPPLYYATIGHFADWWFCNVTLLADYQTLARSPAREGSLLAARVLLPVPLCVGMIYAIGLAVRHRALEVRDALVALLATGWLALFASVVPGFHKGHYLVQGLALECLLIGVTLVDGWHYLVRPRGGRRRALAALVGVALVAPLGWGVIDLWRGRVELAAITPEDFFVEPHRRSGVLPSVVDFVGAHSAADDLIYVHSEAPELYVLTRRTPAVNDPSGSWIAHFPTRRNAEILLQQLQKTPPRLIVQLAYRRYGREDEVLQKWPELWAWVLRNYRLGMSTSDLQIFERDTSATGPAAGSPQPR